MVKKSSRLVPKLDPIRLVDLADGSAESLKGNGSYEAQRFTSIDLSERPLAGVSFYECEFVGLIAHQTDFRSASFIESRIENLNAPVFTAPRSRFRDVRVDSSRMGSAEFYESMWHSVHFSNCKLGFVNLRGAELQDVLFVNCTIDELDLGDVKANRLAFKEVQVNSLDVTRSTLKNVDLRGLDIRKLAGLEGLKGATMNPYQITELAPIFATQFGIMIED